MNLTPEQEKRKARNDRYRNKQKASKNRLELIPNILNIEPLLKKNLFRKESIPLIAKGLILSSITILLIFFQARAYAKEHAALSWSIAILCETSLLYLSLLMRRSLFAKILFAVLFLYTLAAASFDVKKTEVFQTSSKASHDLKVSSLKDLIKLSHEDIDRSLAKGETINRRLKDLGEIIKSLNSVLAEKNETAFYSLDLIQYEVWMLIVLRCLLMCISALLIRDIIPPHHPHRK